MQQYFKCYYFEDAKKLNPVASLIYMMFVNRHNLSVSFGTTGINGKCFYDPLVSDYYIVYSKDEIFKNIPCKTSPRSISRALDELEDKGFISRIHKEHYNRIQLPNVDKLDTYQPRHAKVTAIKPECQNGTLQNANLASQYKDTKQRTFNSTCNTRNTQTEITKSAKNTGKKLKLKQKLDDKALDLIAKTTNERTSNSIPKLVDTVKTYSFGNYKSYYHYFGLFFRAKKSILNKLRKKPSLTIYDFKLYKQGLTLEINSLFNTKEAAHKVYKIIWHAGKLYDKSKDQKGRDRYMMKSFQNLLGTYAYNYVLDQSAEHGPEIPIIDDKIAG